MAKRAFKLYQGPVVAVRKPKVLIEVQQSFKLSPTSDDIDFHGHRRKKNDNNTRPYQLSEMEMDIAAACLAEGLSWQYTMRRIFSLDPTNPVSLSKISESKYKAAELYLQYLRRNGVKVSEVRRGMTGRLRERVANTCGQLMAYHKQISVSAKPYKASVKVS